MKLTVTPEPGGARFTSAQTGTAEACQSVVSMRLGGVSVNRP